MLIFAPSEITARNNQRVADVNIIRDAIQKYYLDHNAYPKQDDIWCSIESDCNNLISEIASYLPKIPKDPLYGKGEESPGKLYSYQYVTKNNGTEYKIHADLEIKRPYEVYSIYGKPIRYPYDRIISNLGESFNFDPIRGNYPAVAKIDQFHYLVTYQGKDNTGKINGWATVLQVDLDNEKISYAGNPFQFDSQWIGVSHISPIDANHYLVAYQGWGQGDSNGSAIVLAIDENWKISVLSSRFVYDPDPGGGAESVISQIDSNYYLIAYQGTDDQGHSIVLRVDAYGTWNIGYAAGYKNDFEFENTFFANPDLIRINSNYHLITYAGPGSGEPDGWAKILKVDTANWSIYEIVKSVFRFEPGYCRDPNISPIDANHYLVVYDGKDAGQSVVLKVDTDNTWEVGNAGNTFSFYPHSASHFHASPIDSTNYLVVNHGLDNLGWATALEIDKRDWSISTSSGSYNFDVKEGWWPEIVSVEPNYHLVVYCSSYDPTGYGLAVILKLEDLIP